MRNLLKKLNLFVAFLVLSIAFSSCAIHSGLTSNLNNHDTQVVLSKGNFKVVARVQGTSSGVSVFGFGGTFKAAIADARKEMLENANLVGTSRAIINETVEVNNESYAGIVNVKRVTVSAYIIEFTE